MALVLADFFGDASLVFFAAGGPTKFSYLNWISSSRYAFIGLFWEYPPLLVLVLLSAWISERRVMRDAEAWAVQDPSQSVAPGSGALGEFPTCLWENTESISVGSACTLGSIALVNWRRLSFTTLEIPN
jgi:hypothetical protein